MSLDREQIREDAVAFDASPRLGDHCLALLAELEQAEEQFNAMRDQLGWTPPADSIINSEPLDEATTLGLLKAQIRDLESRLAKVPALVEALKEIETRGEDTSTEFFNGYLADIATNALAAWETE